MDSMVSYGGGSGSVVNSVVREYRGGMGNKWSGMDSVVGHGGGMDSVVCHGGGMDSVVSYGMWCQGNSWSEVRGVVSGGDNNTTMADSGVVGDISTDPGDQGTQCYYCCYLH